MLPVLNGMSSGNIQALDADRDLLMLLISKRVLITLQRQHISLLSNVSAVCVHDCNK